MPLTQVGECIFDAGLLNQSHGYESLDPVAREAFVNHLHITGNDAVDEAQRIIESWMSDMRQHWPTRTFRIYRHTDSAEVTIRFHTVRNELANWCEQGVEIMTVRNPS
jgi:hypothetical protein